MPDWTEQQLAQIDAAKELEITSRRADGSLRSWLPIWVVRADGEVFVRTWHRRTTGWFGQVVKGRGARIRVPGLETEVSVEDLGEGTDALRARVDDAYRAKYGRYGDESVGQMVNDSAAATTLRLVHD
jgi:hypothetical protein